MPRTPPSPPSFDVASVDPAELERAIELTLRARLPGLVAEVLERLRRRPEPAAPPPREEWFDVARREGRTGLEGIVPHEREEVVRALVDFGLDRERKARRWVDSTRIRELLLDGILREVQRHGVFLETSTNLTVPQQTERRGS